MQTLTVVLVAAGVLLLILLAFTPCGRDHYADQVVHAGVGNIAGPIVQIDETPYVPPGSHRDSYVPLMEEDEYNSVIVGKTS
jgi:hypothetical protein